MTAVVLETTRAEDVWQILAEHVQPGPTEEIVVDRAVGAVLAGDVLATFDFPPFDRAMMDGYAVRSADFAAGPATLRNAGLVRAGVAQPARLAPATCMQINTGAPLPDGADAVVIVERATELPDGRVHLDDRPKPGQNIDRRAALVPRNARIVPAGTRVDAGAAAAIVSGGVTRVRLYRRPGVALLSTGDEIVPGGAALEPGQIYDSNSVVLAEFVRQSGADPISLGRCSDEPAALGAALRRGLEYEVLCVTGGMSKGSHDLVPGLLEELGVTWLVRSLHLKPGRPTRIGRGPSGGWVLGLPGNPVSCTVCFLLFARCILEGLQGLPVRPPPHLMGRVTAALPANGERPMYHPAHWSVGPGGDVSVTPAVWRGSGDPFGLVGTNALLYRPERAAPAVMGDPVRFVPIDLSR